jgi:hypothetical protein
VVIYLLTCCIGYYVAQCRKHLPSNRQGQAFETIWLHHHHRHHVIEFSRSNVLINNTLITKVAGNGGARFQPAVRPSVRPSVHLKQECRSKRARAVHLLLSNSLILYQRVPVKLIKKWHSGISRFNRLPLSSAPYYRHTIFKLLLFTTWGNCISTTNVT